MSSKREKVTLSHHLLPLSLPRCHSVNWQECACLAFVGACGSSQTQSTHTCGHTPHPDCAAPHGSLSRSLPARRVSRWHQVLRQNRVSWGAGPGAQACPSQLQSSCWVASCGACVEPSPPSPAFPGGRPHRPVAPP